MATAAAQAEEDERELERTAAPEGDEEGEDEEEDEEEKKKAKTRGDFTLASDAPTTPLKERLSTLQSNERLHKQFSQKLCRALETRDSAELIGETSALSAPSSSYMTPQKKGGSGSGTKRGSRSPSIKYTPLEQQVLAVKEDHPDVLLLVECGYKYRFFGKDAEIASKVLSIGCFPSHNFMTASVPVHRLYIHVRRLVEAGYKVGVVNQLETAAIKAAGSASKSGPFKRALTALYTKATFIPDDIDSSLGDSASPNLLLCLYERAPSSERVHFGLVAIQLATGYVVYDDFDDDFTREALETRLAHLQPSELVLPQTLSAPSMKLIHRVSSSHAMRIERIDDSRWDYNSALLHLTEFFNSSSSSAFSSSSSSSQDEGEMSQEDAAKTLERLLQLPQSILPCFSVLVEHLSSYHLANALRLTTNFKHFSNATTMFLPGSTLANLELFQTQDEGNAGGQQGGGGEKGTLFWLLNQTKTAFGARLLRKWIQQPLLATKEIEARLDAVTEIKEMDPSSCCFKALLSTLHQVPDLERGLAQCHYKKCSTQAFLSMLRAYERIMQALPAAEVVENKVSSSLLRNLLSTFPDLSADVQYFMGCISAAAAAEGDKLELFVLNEEEPKYPEVAKYKKLITTITQGLHAHLLELRKRFGMPNLEYMSRNQTEYMIELKNTMAKKIPNDWLLLSSTKTAGRYHSPFISEKLQELALYKEKLMLACTDAWNDFLGEFGEKYDSFHVAMKKMATLDCLNSLALVANGRDGYVRPHLVDSALSSSASSSSSSEITEEAQLIIKDGRHPCVEAIMADSGRSQMFVPNDTNMAENGERCVLLTGPNMGGKTSYIRQTALIVIMAQIGSYVPASYVKLSPFDGIYTRMGASDNIDKGQSTFFVELSETSTILRKATNRSLVILDELGRGTSTHDGVAIAYATLKYIIEKVKCFTLFVTHYPILAELEETYPNLVHNYHMAFLEHAKQAQPDELAAAAAAESQEESSDALDQVNPENTITFLYKLKRGMAKKSYGLNVALLAEVPKEVVKVAAHKAHEFERYALHKRQIATFRRIVSSLPKQQPNQQ
ncbi:Mismatch repair protein msh3 [Balamuthia mandrillaris]